MADTPWLSDACSLVDAFRSGERSPAEELDAVLTAIDASELNAFTFVDPERARDAAATADVSKPFGGVPIGIKELEFVEGWPATEASLVFKDRIASYTRTIVERVLDAGAVPVGLTAASEFGGLNISTTKLNGITHNPWQQGKTAGGSSGGSASAVAGGLVSLATGGDGGGSIRIPAGFNGLPGMKGTAGRIPRGPFCEIAPLTVVLGCLSRSVRDVARFYDVAAGFDPRDPYSLPSEPTWERDLGTHDLAGKRVAIAPTLGSAVVRQEVQDLVVEAGEALARDAGLEIVDVPVTMPVLGFEWAMANLVQLRRDLEGVWPDRRDDLTLEIAFGLQMADEHYNLALAARGEEQRIHVNELMADVFDQVDFVIAATNPDVAFPAEVSTNTRVGDQQVGLENNGILTIPANIVGNPAVSIPVGTVDGLPVGMQVIGKHHQDALLLDLALLAERERPWPLVAPDAPR
ncbi:MAG TPA: amidase [Acidimicrobiia bacterium]|nr:amidase [Acidimicrobiia bacterium]